MSYQGFYFSVSKDIDDMTLEELGQEIESAEYSERTMEVCGQGISSKETVRHRFCKMDLARRKAGIALDMPIREFARSMAKMLTPI